MGNYRSNETRKLGAMQERIVLAAGDHGEVRLYSTKEKASALLAADRGYLNRFRTQTTVPADIYSLTDKGKIAYDLLAKQREEKLMQEAAAHLYKTIIDKYGTTNVMQRLGDHFDLDPARSSVMAEYARVTARREPVIPALGIALTALRHAVGEERYTIIFTSFYYAYKRGLGMV